MTQEVETIQRLRQYRFNLKELAVLLITKSKSKINFPSVDASGQRLLGRVAIQLLQRFADRDRPSQLRRRTVLQLYVNLAHSRRNLYRSIAALPPDVRTLDCGFAA